ncbi:Ig-like domain-containing protein, partial [Escherichia coli]|uniref:Ig-like domain-containing protein n=1 Tax=Escherichia coli TaxID=562 RepID=UPI00202CBE47
APSASLGYNTATPIDLTASVRGAQSSLTVSTAPAHGTTSVAGDVVTYTPTTGYYGSDSFAYTATGPGGTSAAATVTLTVATPAAPSVAAKSASVGYNTATPIDLTASVSGAQSSLTV